MCAAHMQGFKGILQNYNGHYSSTLQADGVEFGDLLRDFSFVEEAPTLDAVDKDNKPIKKYRIKDAAEHAADPNSGAKLKEFVSNLEGKKILKIAGKGNFGASDTETVNELNERMGDVAKYLLENYGPGEWNITFDGDVLQPNSPFTKLIRILIEEGYGALAVKDMQPKRDLSREFVEGWRDAFAAKQDAKLDLVVVKGVAKEEVQKTNATCFLSIGSTFVTNSAGFRELLDAEEVAKQFGLPNDGVVYPLEKTDGTTMDVYDKSIRLVHWKGKP